MYYYLRLCKINLMGLLLIVRYCIEFEEYWLIGEIKGI